MLNPLLPRTADNNYRGSRIALVVFGLLLLAKTGISLGSIFNGYAAATSADGIPLDSYSPAATQTVVALFALLGLANLMICLTGVVVLIRYRALIPFMFVVFLIYQLSRKLILEILPVARAGTPPVFGINSAILGLIIIGLVLSLWRRGDHVETRTHGSG